MPPNDELSRLAALDDAADDMERRDELRFNVMSVCLLALGILLVGTIVYYVCNI